MEAIEYDLTNKEDINLFQEFILLSKEIDYLFIVLKSLTINEASVLFNEDGINKIISSKNQVLIHVLMGTKLPYINELFTCDSFCNLFYTFHNNSLYNKLNEKCAYLMAKFIIVNRLNNAYLSKLSESVQEYLVNNTDIIDLLIDKTQYVYTLNNLPPIFCNSMIRKKNFKLMATSHAIIFLLENGVNIEGVIGPRIIIDIINNQHTNVLPLLQNNNPNLYEETSKELDTYYDKNIHNLIYASDIKDFIAMRFFKDSYHNLSQNIIQMLDYTNYTKMSLIPRKNLILYKSIIELYEPKHLLNIYYRMQESHIDFISQFYDDYRTLRDSSNHNLVEGLLDPSTLLSKDENNVEIKELQDEEFYALIHCTGSSKTSSKVPSFDNPYISTISLSLISNNLINTFTCKNVILGYSSLNPDFIVHTCFTDSFSDLEDVKAVNNIATKEMLIESTAGYNEIVYQETKLEDRTIIDDGRSKLLPTYVLAIDTIERCDYMTAVSYGIPIVLLHSKQYKNTNRSIFKLKKVYDK